MPSPKRTVMPAKGRRGETASAGGLSFSALVAAIRQAHEQCAAQATRAVNVGLTLRNWVIGWYIREYEQNGADRAIMAKPSWKRSQIV